MKVMCISKDPPAEFDLDLIEAANKMQVGDILTIIEDDPRGYEFEEYPHPLQILWDKKCFSLLSAIDEKEFQREYSKEPATA